MISLFKTSSAQIPILKIDFNKEVKDNSVNKYKIETEGQISFKKDRFFNSCNAGYFDGKSYLKINSNKNLNSIRKFSVSCWISPEKNNNGNIWLSLFCKGDKVTETNNNPQVRAQIFQNDFQRTISINSIFTKNDLNFNSPKIEANKWSHLVMTFDGVFVKFYLDKKIIFNQYYYNDIYQNKSPLFIGYDVPGSTEYFKGLLDDYMIFDFALSKTEVNNIYNNKNSTKNKTQTSCPNEIIVESLPSKCGNYVEYETSQSDCENNSSEVLKGKPSGSFFKVGTTKNVIKFTSETKSYICNFNIVVNDKEKPEIKCPKDTIIYSEYLKPISIPKPQVYDNCQIKYIKNISLNDSVINKFGDLDIEYEVCDESDNKNTCVFNLKYLKKQRLYPNDLIKIKDTINFESEEITLSIYDHAVQDNDTISIIYNNKEIVSKRMVKNKKNGCINILININEKNENLFIFKAWNEGKIKPNTIKIDFYEGNIFRKKQKIKKISPKNSLILNSRPGQSTGLIIFKKK